MFKRLHSSNVTMLQCNILPNTMMLQFNILRMLQCNILTMAADDYSHPKMEEWGHSKGLDQYPAENTSSPVVPCVASLGSKGLGTCPIPVLLPAAHI